MNRVLSLALLSASCALVARADCFDRYAVALDAAQQSVSNAPKDQKPALAEMVKALMLVRMKVGIDQDVLPPETCKTTIAAVEVQTFAWHQMGWWRTREEQEAARNAAATQALQDALARLEGRH